MRQALLPTGRDACEVRPCDPCICGSHLFLASLCPGSPEVFFTGMCHPRSRRVLLLIEFVIRPLHGTRHTPCVPYLVRVGGVLTAPFTGKFDTDHTSRAASGGLLSRDVEQKAVLLPLRARVLRALSDRAALCSAALYQCCLGRSVPQHARTLGAARSWFFLHSRCRGPPHAEAP